MFPHFKILSNPLVDIFNILSTTQTSDGAIETDTVIKNGRYLVNQVITIFESGLSFHFTFHASNLLMHLKNKSNRHQRLTGKAIAALTKSNSFFKMNLQTFQKLVCSLSVDGYPNELKKGVLTTFQGAQKGTMKRKTLDSVGAIYKKIMPLNKDLCRLYFCALLLPSVLCENEEEWQLALLATRDETKRETDQHGVSRTPFTADALIKFIVSHCKTPKPPLLT